MVHIFCVSAVVATHFVRIIVPKYLYVYTMQSGPSPTDY